VIPTGGGIGILAAFLFPFYADELTTMAVRIRDGETLTQAHRKHVYQLLANECGIVHWKVSLGYGAVQLGIGSATIMMRHAGIGRFYRFLWGVFCSSCCFQCSSG
jgi:Fuc2NAc and GlcNAc transferase